MGCCFQRTANIILLLITKKFPNSFILCIVFIFYFIKTNLFITGEKLLSALHFLSLSWWYFILSNSLLENDQMKKKSNICIISGISSIQNLRAIKFYSFCGMLIYCLLMNNNWSIFYQDILFWLQFLYILYFFLFSYLCLFTYRFLNILLLTIFI